MQNVYKKQAHFECNMLCCGAYCYMMMALALCIAILNINYSAKAECVFRRYYKFLQNGNPIYINLVEVLCETTCKYSAMGGLSIYIVD